MCNYKAISEYHRSIAVFVAAAMTIFIASCSYNKYADAQLDTVERLMPQYPDSATRILIRIDTAEISDKQKARRNLLYAYGCVIHAMPLQLDSTDIHYGDDHFIGDFSADEVKWLIIKSYDARNHRNNVARIEYLKDAEFLAIQLDDKFELAMIYQYLARVYEEGFNGTVSKYYADKSMALLRELDCPKQLREARFAEAAAFCAKRDFKAMLEVLLSMKEEVMMNAPDSYKVFFLDHLARSYDANNQTDKAIQIWNSIYRGEEISPNTLAHMAMAYWRVNKLDSAYVLIQKTYGLPLDNTDEFLCRKVERLILEKMGRKSALPAIDSLQSLAAGKVFDDRKLEESSLALNQKYDSAARLAWIEASQARARTRIAIFALIVISIIAVASYLYLHKRNQVLKLEHENDVLKITTLQNNLFENNSRQQVLSSKISEYFQSRFKLMDDLAASYFECKETGQEQKRIYTEVKNALSNFSSAAASHELEDIVNGYNENMMTAFREDFPKLSQAQYRLALYLFCGFSLPSISIFTGSDLRNIYVYKSRLKSVILKSDSLRKEEYLGYFS